MYNGDTARRTGIGDNGWSRLEYDGTTVYAISSYLTTDLNSKPYDNTNGNFSVNGMEFSPYNDNVTAKEETNLRTLPSTDNGHCGYIHKEWRICKTYSNERTRMVTG